MVGAESYRLLSFGSGSLLGKCGRKKMARTRSETVDGWALGAGSYVLGLAQAELLISF